MAQHDMNVANADGATVRADINSALAALVGNNSGATEPSTTFSYMWWADTANGLLKIRNAANSAWVTVGTLASANLGHLVSSDIGTTVQGYDANTAKLNTDQSWSGSQRGTITTDNDGNFDLAAANNFSCERSVAQGTGSGCTLTFTNIASAAGQSGFIKFINGSNYTIGADGNTKVGTSTLTTISATGTYLLSYFSDGTNVYVVNSGALA